MLSFHADALGLRYTVKIIKRKWTDWVSSWVGKRLSARWISLVYVLVELGVRRRKDFGVGCEKERDPLAH